MAEEKLENKPKRSYEKKERTTKETRTPRRKLQEEEKTTRPYHKRNSTNKTKNIKESSSSE